MRAEVVTSFPMHAKAITPSDVNDLTDHDGNEVGQTVYVGVDGVVVVQPTGNPDGQNLTFTLVAKDFVPVQVRKVLSTNTTATGLIGLW